MTATRRLRAVPLALLVTGLVLGGCSRTDQEPAAAPDEVGASEAVTAVATEDQVPQEVASAAPEETAVVEGAAVVNVSGAVTAVLETALCADPAGGQAPPPAEEGAPPEGLVQLMTERTGAQVVFGLTADGTPTSGAVLIDSVEFPFEGASAGTVTLDDGQVTVAGLTLTEQSGDRSVVLDGSVACAA